MTPTAALKKIPVLNPATEVLLDEVPNQGLEEFQQAKHIHWDFEQKAKPWWYPYAPKKASKN